jgi:hypothetical protein
VPIDQRHNRKILRPVVDPEQTSCRLTGCAESGPAAAAGENERLVLSLISAAVPLELLLKVSSIKRVARPLPRPKWLCASILCRQAIRL